MTDPFSTFTYKMQRSERDSISFSLDCVAKTKATYERETNHWHEAVNICHSLISPDYDVFH